MYRLRLKRLHTKDSPSGHWGCRYGQKGLIRLGEALQLLLLIRRYYGTSSYDKAWTFNHFQARFDLDAYLASCP